MGGTTNLKAGGRSGSREKMRFAKESRALATDDTLLSRNLARDQKGWFELD